MTGTCCCGRAWKSGVLPQHSRRLGPRQAGPPSSRHPHASRQRTERPLHGPSRSTYSKLPRQASQNGRQAELELRGRNRYVAPTASTHCASQLLFIHRARRCGGQGLGADLESSLLAGQSSSSWSSPLTTLSRSLLTSSVPWLKPFCQACPWGVVGSYGGWFSLRSIPAA